jgi:hypothetical protein
MQHTPANNSIADAPSARFAYALPKQCCDVARSLEAGVMR